MFFFTELHIHSLGSRQIEYYNCNQFTYMYMYIILIEL